VCPNSNVLIWENGIPYDFYKPLDQTTRDVIEHSLEEEKRERESERETSLFCGSLHYQNTAHNCA